jgi:hypothetical protein
MIIKVNLPKATLTFLLTSAISYCLLSAVLLSPLVPQGTRNFLTIRLNLLIAIATGMSCVALVPRTKKPEIPKSSEKIPPPPPTGGPTVSLDEYNDVVALCFQWESYCNKKLGDIAVWKKRAELLDKRQSVLQIAMFGVFSIALIWCVDGFYFPPVLPVIFGPPAITPETFVSNICSFAGTIAATGMILGVAVSYMRAVTKPFDAFRCGLLAGSLTSISSFLIALPYIFTDAWKQPVLINSKNVEPFIIVMVSRLFVFPIFCSVFSYLGYLGSEWILSRLYPSRITVDERKWDADNKKIFEFLTGGMGLAASVMVYFQFTSMPHPGDQNKNSDPINPETLEASWSFSSVHSHLTNVPSMITFAHDKTFEAETQSGAGLLQKQKRMTISGRWRLLNDLLVCTVSKSNDPVFKSNETFTWRVKTIEKKWISLQVESEEVGSRTPQ